MKKFDLFIIYPIIFILASCIILISEDSFAMELIYENDFTRVLRCNGRRTPLVL